MSESSVSSFGGEKTDRELLELAAKAAGVNGSFAAFKELDTEKWGIVTFMGYGSAKFWNPLTDDGDALRLAVKLNMGMDILGFNRRVFVHAQGAQASVEEPHGSDPYAATRRAIVRAAASLPPQQTA